ncbi:O-methyltransferase family protein [Euphorbia peplus]|nr:O-methyltransferase family protein [Euphorbia peplus]
MGSIHQEKQQVELEEKEKEEACVNAMLFSTSHVLPMVFRAAMELDLFSIIAKSGPNAYVSAYEIASNVAIKTNEDAASMIDRMLRLFASHSLLSSSSRTTQDGSLENVYCLTPACNFFVSNGSEQQSLSALSALSFHPASLQVWFHMKDAIVEGGSMFKKVHGMSIFEYMNKDEEYNKIFNDAMGALSSIVMKEVLDVYKGFDGITSLVDVGGGNGTVLNIIISKYPSIRGINYDLPHVTQSAPSYHGIQHVGGNMLSNIPNGQAIMIKDTCHNWSDENVIKVLKNIYEALPENGKLIVMNAILPEKPETTKASQYVSRLDNTMLMQPCGKERTANQFQSLVIAAGFSNFRVACLARGIWAVMESYK